MNRRDPLDSLTTILHLDPDAAERQELEAEQIDWPATIGLAQSHLLGPALWPALVEKKLAAPLPPALHDFLRKRASGDRRHYLLALEEDHRANAMRNAAIRDQASAIIAALNGAGIEPGALKGARTLLEDDGASSSFTRSRVLRDIDLLVPVAQWELAARALDKAGYRKTGEGPNTAAFHHAMGGVELDLHRAPLALHEPLPLPEFLTADGFWRHAKAVAMPDLRWRRLEPAQSLLHGILHTEIADLNYAAGDWALRYLYETAYLTRSFSTWPDTSALETAEVVRAVNAHLFAAHRLFGGALPPGFVADVPARRHFARCRLNARHPRTIRRAGILFHKLRQAMTPWYLARAGFYRPESGQSLLSARLLSLAALCRRHLPKLPRLLFGGDDSGIPPPRV